MLTTLTWFYKGPSVADLAVGRRCVAVDRSLEDPATVSVSMAKTRRIALVRTHITEEERPPIGIV